MLATTTDLIFTLKVIRDKFCLMRSHSAKI